MCSQVEVDECRKDCPFVVKAEDAQPMETDGGERLRSQFLPLLGPHIEDMMGL